MLTGRLSIGAAGCVGYGNASLESAKRGLFLAELNTADFYYETFAILENESSLMIRYGTS